MCSSRSARHNDDSRTSCIPRYPGWPSRTCLGRGFTGGSPPNEFEGAAQPAATKRHTVAGQGKRIETRAGTETVAGAGCLGGCLCLLGGITEQLPEFTNQAGLPRMEQPAPVMSLGSAWKVKPLRIRNRRGRALQLAPDVVTIAVVARWIAGSAVQHFYR